MSATSTLDLLKKEYPSVPEEWLMGLAMKSNGSAYDTMKREAMLLGALIGVVGEMKAQLIAAAASMGEINTGDYRQITSLYNLIYQEYLYFLENAAPPVWDDEVDPLQAWSSFFDSKEVPDVKPA